MSAARSPIAAIDAAIARGEWWLRLFEELSDLGVQRAEALPLPRAGALRRMVQVADRVFRAARLAIVASLRLDEILSALKDLRGRSAAEIAAVLARARAKAEADAAAREPAADRASARREARAAERPDTDDEDEEDQEDAEDQEDQEDAEDQEDEDGEADDEADEKVDAPETETAADPRDRDPLVTALDRRLAAVDPAIVDFDDLRLRETVQRICADLGVTPDWVRWEAGEWLSFDAPAQPPPVQSPPAPPTRREGPRPAVLPALPGSVPPPAAATPPARFPAERDAERRRPRRE